MSGVDCLIAGRLAALIPKKTFLTLIPKKTAPTTLADYSSIFCLGVPYKIMEKILASMMMTILPNLIILNQTDNLHQRMKNQLRNQSRPRIHARLQQQRYILTHLYNDRV